MKIIYRIVRNEWFENKPDLTEGVKDYDDAEEALIEKKRLNDLVPVDQNVQYHVQALDYWNK